MRELKKACCCFADQCNHVGDALCSVRTELVLEVERSQHGFDIGLEDRGWFAILHRQQHERNDPLCDGGIAVSQEMEATT